MTTTPDPAILTCSFCGKTQREVRKLIAGPACFICDECVNLCNDIMVEENLRNQQWVSGLGIPKPHEIKAILDEYIIGQDKAKKSHETIQNIGKRISELLWWLWCR